MCIFTPSGPRAQTAGRQPCAPFVAAQGAFVDTGVPTAQTGEPSM
jgi:hypothetical protein